MSTYKEGSGTQVSYMNSTNVSNPNQLPIFQVLGDQISSPEGKKTVAKIFFVAIIAALAYLFIQILPTLLASALSTLYLVAVLIALFTLVKLSPKIVNSLHNVGRTMIHKFDKTWVEKNAISTLEMMHEDVKETRKLVAERITRVEGLTVGMRADAEEQNKEAEAKFSLLRTRTQNAADLDAEAVKLEGEGNTDAARAKRRLANETRSSAGLLKSEGESALELARTYAQYGNQFGKALEILKDNESAIKIYDNSFASSIKIVRKKLDMTQKMNAATTGMAEIFGFKDSWKFQVAMESAKFQISNNIGSIKRNLEFLSENRLENMQTTKSQGELEDFIKQLDSGKMQKLNISEISDASHTLKPDEIVDKTLNILD